MSLLIGTSWRNITPQPGVELSGFLYRVQPSLGAHDPLKLRCVYLVDGDRRLLWLHADLIGLDSTFVTSLRQWVQRRLGLSPHQLVLSTTHTHSGPATVRLIGCGEPDPRYVGQLHIEFERAALEAVSATEPVTLLAATGKCELGIDRRRTASAHVDHRVGLVGLRRRDGSFAAIIANYAMHNVALGHQNRLISADLFGHAAERASALLPGQPTVLFTAGAAANVNPPRTGVDFPQVQAWGEQLARSVVEAISEGQEDAASPLLRSAAQRIELPLHSPDHAWIEHVSECAKGQVQGRDDDESKRYRTAVDVWANEMRNALARRAVPTSAAVELQAIALGHSSFLCINAEIFSRLADELRAALEQDRCWVVGYANGLIGYVPTPKALDEGGYEVEHAFIFYGGLPLRRGAFEAIRDRAVELLGSLQSQRLAECAR
ncbi:hypothetical protein [Fontivita pretiosa]|uniref:hypothetical protein n=1 Tax=Fontivita pretiosa TaxID=2989684 RepID=UPI003D174177